MRSYLAIAVLLIGCSSKPAGDECQRLGDKMKPVVAEMAKLAGKELKPADEAKMVDQCRTALKEGHRDPAMDCILKAVDDAAVRACIKTGLGSYTKKTKSIEAKVMLNRMAKELKVVAATSSAFPIGKVGPTPATPCCQQPDKKCAANAADWSDPIWKALDFSLDEAGRFQYSYESDGKTATATAVGDLDCDGKPQTIKLTGTVNGGNPEVTVTDAP